MISLAWRSVRIQQRDDLSVFNRETICTYSTERRSVRIQQREVLYVFNREKICTYSTERGSVHIPQWEDLEKYVEGSKIMNRI